jgi:hypothetical protein
MLLQQLLYQDHQEKKKSNSDILKIAFDGDAVIFSDESEKFFMKKALKHLLKMKLTLNQF